MKSPIFIFACSSLLMNPLSASWWKDIQLNRAIPWWQELKLKSSESATSSELSQQTRPEELSVSESKKAVAPEWAENVHAAEPVVSAEGALKITEPHASQFEKADQLGKKDDIGKDENKEEQVLLSKINNIDISEETLRKIRVSEKIRRRASKPTENCTFDVFPILTLASSPEEKTHRRDQLAQQINLKPNSLLARYVNLKLMGQP